MRLVLFAVEACNHVYLEYSLEKLINRQMSNISRKGRVWGTKKDQITVSCLLEVSNFDMYSSLN